VLILPNCQKKINSSACVIFQAAIACANSYDSVRWTSNCACHWYGIHEN